MRRLAGLRRLASRARQVRNGRCHLDPLRSRRAVPFGRVPRNLETRHVIDHANAAPDVDAVRPIELEVVRVQVHPSIPTNATSQLIDPEPWRPLIMSFQSFFGIRPELSPVPALDDTGGAVSLVTIPNQTALARRRLPCWLLGNLSGKTSKQLMDGGRRRHESS